MNKYVNGYKRRGYKVFAQMEISLNERWIQLQRYLCQIYGMPREE